MIAFSSMIFIIRIIDLLNLSESSCVNSILLGSKTLLKKKTIMFYLILTRTFPKFQRVSGLSMTVKELSSFMDDRSTLDVRQRA